MLLFFIPPGTRNRPFAAPQPEELGETTYHASSDYCYADIINWDYPLEPLRENTMFVRNFKNLPGNWNPTTDKEVPLCEVSSTQMRTPAPARTHLTSIETSGNTKPLVGDLSDRPTDLEQALFTAATGIVVVGNDPADFIKGQNRYFSPQTTVSARIDELVLEENGEGELLLDRRQQAGWLKQALASRWAAHLPQPFIGFDLEDGLFTASWQSNSECNTLTIDAETHTGWYDPWPADEEDNPLPGELDLDTEEVWRRLRFALMTTRP